MRRIAALAALLAALLAAPAAAQSRSSVTLLHFSDYHAHAAPFYSEGQAGTAGIAGPRRGPRVRKFGTTT